MKWWAKDVKICLDIRDKSIPKEYLLPEDKLPPEDQQNVLDVPSKSGILTDEELEMLELDVPQLLEAYRKRTWTVRQVVTAYLKQAVIMHQLV